MSWEGLERSWKPVGGFQNPVTKRRERLSGRLDGRPVGATTNETATGGIFGQVSKVLGDVKPQLDAGGTGTSTGSGISSSMGQSPYGSFLKSLTQPVQSPYQSQFKEKAALLKEYTQGAYDTAAEGLRSRLASRQGLITGESGIADTALGRLRQEQAQEQSRGYRGLMTEESQREQEMALNTAAMNLQRKLGGAGLALQGEESIMDRMMQYYQSQLGAETSAYQPWWQMQAGISSGG